MARLADNTVKANNQLKKSEFVKITNGAGKGVRVMFLGNSITLHGKKPEIGWNNCWGMAASSEDKDYVHVLMKYIRKTEPDAAFCICQGAKWEVHYKEDIDFYDEYESARDFGADIIVSRIIENCKGSDFDGEKFKTGLTDFIGYLSGKKSPKIILTTSFWHHPGDSAIKELSEEKGYPLVTLGDLGDNKEMMAIGLFEHEGVSIHPGDKGMRCIADRIFKIIEDIL